MRHKILFVCHGNICRSPMAQFIFQDIVNRAGKSATYLVDSAATTRAEIDFRGHGNPLDPRTVAILQKEKIPFCEHHARQLGLADYQKFDLLIGMDEENICDLQRLTHGDPQGKIKKLPSFSGLQTDIADPWYTNDFATTFYQLKKNCQNLFKYLETESTSSLN